jgi:integrase
MATLRKRKNKSGRIVYLIDFHLNGRRFVRSTKTDDLKTAKLILKDIEAKIAKKTFKVEEISSDKKVYLKQFAHEYLGYSGTHKAPKTVLRDQLTLKTFMNQVGDRTLTTIDHKLIDQYLNSRAQSVKKSTVNIELRHLKAAFSKGVQWGYIEKNPFGQVRPFRIPESAPLFFAEAEILNLLKSIEEHWLKEIVIFAMNTGVRIGELINLEWSDIDFGKRVIQISQKDDFTTKSKRERLIPMNNEVFELLTGFKRNGSYVFPTAEGLRRGQGFISKRFKRHVRKIGMDERFTFHSLRHTFASHLVQKGVSLYIVSKLLGHSNLKTTEVYAHLAPETFQEVVNLLSFQSGVQSGISSGITMFLDRKSVGNGL